MKPSAVPSTKDRTSPQRPFLNRFLITYRVGFLTFLGAVSACAPTPSTILKEAPSVEQTEEVVRITEKDQLQQAYRDFTMAAISLTRGNLEEARTYLESAIQKDPDSVYLHQKMALLLKELREYPEALAYAQKAVDLDPSDATSITLTCLLYTSDAADE